MKHFRVGLIIFIIILFTGGAVYLGRTFYLKLNKPAESPLKAIPENTALILRINRPNNLWAELKQENLIWREISSIPLLKSLNQQIDRIDSLVKSNMTFFEITQKNPLLIAVTLTGRSTYGVLFLISIPGVDGDDEIISLLEDKYAGKISIHRSPYSSANLVRVSLPGNKEPFYFAVSEGVFLGSLHPEIIRKSIDQLSLNIPSVINTGFQKVESSTGKKVDANIFFNYRLIYPLISRLLQPGQVPEITKISQFADWSGLDIILKKNEFLINGFTTLSNPGNQYLGIFSQQLPQNVSVTSILPDNTSRFLWMGYHDLDKFFHNFLSFSGQNDGYREPSSDLTDFETRNQISVRDYLLPWIGNELCLTGAVNTRESHREDFYAVFPVKDKQLADSLLSDLQTMNGKIKDSIVYKDKVIRSLHLPDLIRSVFGTNFRKINSNYYIWINDFVVFGETPLALKYFADHVIYDKVLIKDKNFALLNDNLSDNTNLFYYFSSESVLPDMEPVLSDDVNMQIKNANGTLKKFESVSIQFTNRDEVFYSTIYIHYDPAPGLKESDIPLPE